jgi:hypothetical protein
MKMVLIKNFWSSDVLSYHMSVFLLFVLPIIFFLVLLKRAIWAISSVHTELFKKKYTLSKICFTSTIEHMAMCYILTEGRTLKVIFTHYKHSMWAPRVTRQMSDRQFSSSRTLRSMSQVTAATAFVMRRFRSSISELWEISFPSVHRTRI